MHVRKRDTKAAYYRGASRRRLLLHAPPSIKEQPRLRIFDHPSQPLIQILSRHGAALEDIPPMRLDVLQPKSAQYLLAIHAPRDVRLVGKHQQTGTGQTLFSSVSSPFVPFKKN